MGRRLGFSDQGDHSPIIRKSDITAITGGKPQTWVPGDWNAFFGFGTNILVNVLVMTGLMRFVLKLPDAIVFGRILPAVGLMLFLSTAYYAYLAYRLAKKPDGTTSAPYPPASACRRYSSSSLS